MIYFDNSATSPIDPEVYELNYTNTSEINNNTYTWYLDRSDCTNSQIILTLNRKKNINDSSTNTSNNSNITNNYLPSDQNNIGNITNNDYSEYTMYIFAAIAIVIILIGSYIFKKLKEKSDQNNTIDD